MQGQDERKVLTVKQLTRYIKMKLESDSRLQSVWVQGEISNFTHHSSGHMYFTLKDKDSRVKCVMFASYNQRLPFMPREGSKVIACGSISVFERDGQYQFYVNEMQPDGIGSLFLAFEQLKQKLEQAGWFAAERKRPLPRHPRAIGVITSPTGAAVRDIITTLQRRHPSVAIILYPVLVQGKQAGASIARAIDEMNRLAEVDVLIVGRGGGSLEELWAFNEEIVARSIYDSAIPIISAVGHETDFTIADFVADLRAPTPTAAAELAVAHHLELRRQVDDLTQRMGNGIQRLIEHKRRSLRSAVGSPVFAQPRRFLLQSAERLDRLNEQLVHQLKYQSAIKRESWIRLYHRLVSQNPRQKAELADKRLNTAKQAMVQSMKARLKNEQLRFHSQVRHLDALSPLKVMQRGYGLVYDEQENNLIRTINQVQPGDLIKVKLYDGQLECHVWSMKGEDRDG